MSAARNIAVSLLGAAAWVTAEWVRGKLLLGGFPWNFLGVTQWQSAPVIQIAAFTGVYGVSALMFIVNATFYFTLRRFYRQVVDKVPLRRLSWEFYIAMILLCGSMMRGIIAIRTGLAEPPGKTLSLALVQGNIPQSVKFDLDQKPMILDRYGSLTRAMLAAKPELIIWPETATPEPMRYDHDSFTLVTNLVVQGRTFLLTGTMDITPFSNPPQWYNGAFLVRPNATLQGPYRKIHLVPFGEYVPWRKVLPFMKWLTPIEDSFERGHDLTVFDINGVRCAAVICFEDTLASLCRDFAHCDIDFFVNLTNDAWFKESPAAEQHLASAVFRCVETRRPLVRCTNSGVSCIVDRFGFVRGRLKPFVEGSGTFTLDLPATREQTFYTKHGDVFVAGCAVLTVIAIGLAAFRRNRLESPA